MSEIIFEELELQNFCLIEDLKLALEGRGLLLISGINEDDSSATSNGAGKSSIVDGLCWTLFGTTARGEEGDAVVTRAIGKNCKGCVRFRDGADIYVVERHRKHSKFKNRLIVSQNGVDITKGTDKLTQEALEKILGCTHEVFVASIYAGQEQMPDLPSMTDKELKTLVEDAAGAKVLERAYEIARERARTAERNSEAAQAELNTLNRAIGDAELRALRASESADEWMKNQKKRIDDLKSRLLSLAGAGKSMKAQVDAFDEAAINASIVDIESKLSGVGSPPSSPVGPTPPELPKRKPDPPQPQRDRRMNDLEIRIAHHKREVVALDQEKTRLAHELKHLTAKIGTSCGECSKTYAAEDLDGRKAAIARRAREIVTERAAAERNVHEAELALQTLVKEYDQLLATWQRVCEQQAQDYDTECATLRATYELAREAHQKALDAHRVACAAFDTSALVRALQSERDKLTALAARRSDLDRILTQAREVKQRVAELEAESNPHFPEITHCGNEQRALEAQRAGKELSFQVAKQRADEASAAVDVFAPNGVRGEILDTVTPFLNDRTSNYLGALSDGNIVATWTTIGATGKGELREKFHIKVDNKFGAETFKGQSGGEKRKVRLATAMALQDLVASRAYKPIRLFAADEIDDALDDSGLERLMSILEEKARSTGTVLIVSHNALSDWARNEVTVIKKGGVSRLAA